jgi:hypothetical protein
MSGLRSQEAEAHRELTPLLSGLNLIADTRQFRLVADVAQLQAGSGGAPPPTMTA